MMLSEEERAKFVRYCREEAMSYNELAEQTEKILGSVGEAISRRQRTYAPAYTVVANHFA